MIARTWHGRVPAHRADEYHEYLAETGVATCEGTPGNKGVYVLRRLEGDVAHFTMITLWESTDAIRRFAGDDYEVAVYFPEDDDFLFEREPVFHHEVLEARIG